MRSETDKEATLLGLAQLKNYPEWQTYIKEILLIKDAIASGSYRESGEQLAKTAGVLHGIDIALNINDYIKLKKA